MLWYTACRVSNFEAVNTFADLLQLPNDASIVPLFHDETLPVWDACLSENGGEGEGEDVQIRTKHRRRLSEGCKSMKRTLKAWPPPRTHRKSHHDVQQHQLCHECNIYLPVLSSPSQFILPSFSRAPCGAARTGGSVECCGRGRTTSPSGGNSIDFWNRPKTAPKEFFKRL